MGKEDWVSGDHSLTTMVDSWSIYARFPYDIPAHAARSPAPPPGKWSPLPWRTSGNTRPRGTAAARRGGCACAHRHSTDMMILCAAARV